MPTFRHDARAARPRAPHVAHRMKHLLLRGALPRDIPIRAEGAPANRARPRAGAGERGSGRRRCRRGDSPRTQRAAVPSDHQDARHSLRELPSGGVGHGPATGMSQVHGRARSGGQVGATLAAAPGDHGFPAATAHPHAKTVRLLALAVVGLKRPLHAWPPRIARAEVGAGASAHLFRTVVATGVSARKRTYQCTPVTRSRPINRGRGAARTRGVVERLLRCPQRARVPLPVQPVGPGGGATSPPWPRSSRPVAAGRASPHVWTVLWTMGLVELWGVDRGHSSGR